MKRSMFLRRLHNRPLRFFRKFESLGYAQQVHDERVKLLKNGGWSAQKLAKKLEKCARDREKGKPACGSAACPECQHEFRVRFITQGTRLIVDYLRNEEANAEVYRATVIPDVGTIKRGQLLKPETIKSVETELRRLSEYLRRNDMAKGIMLIGLDVSWNIDNIGNAAPHWQFHLEIVFVGISRDYLREVFNRRYQKTETVLRPVRTRQVKDLTDFPSVVGYCSKLQHHNRTRYLDQNGKARTHKTALKAKQRRALVRFLARLGGVDTQLLLVGARRHGQTLRRVVPTTDGRA